jgi:hypothetical protein
VAPFATPIATCVATIQRRKLPLAGEAGSENGALTLESQGDTANSEGRPIVPVIQPVKHTIRSVAILHVAINDGLPMIVWVVLEL